MSAENILRGNGYHMERARLGFEPTDSLRPSRLFEMMISQKLRHKAQGHLQMILSYIELRQPERATEEIRKLSELINRHVERPDEEEERQLRGRT
jgi:hypothetical protein